ncbi:hypothetical protein F66182_3513 [Fusarium sp. NRRL 66182]|nr:hypothetical protein F66182_3513 [Fusarium sp. NRRL 66182]
MARVWFVTGSSRGLGRCLVEQILASGDTVVATARNPSQLDDLVVKYGPEKIHAVALDVTDAAQAEIAVKEAIEKFNRIDVVVNNAGYTELASVEDGDLASYRKQIDINLFGVVNVTKAVLPILRQQKSGLIIQVSSISGRIGTPGSTAYQSAKWAVGGFSTGLSQEIAPFGIKVIVAEPGFMRTGFAAIAKQHTTISEPYQQTVGEMLKGIDGALEQGSDALDIARAIIYLSQVEDPPLRVALGDMALAYAQTTGKALAESDEKWQHVSKMDF